MKNKLKNFKKILEIIAFLFLLLLIFPKGTKAASATISASSTGTVGSAMTISVTGTGVQWNLNLKVNGTTIASSSELDNYTANERISFSGTYTPTTTGTVTVTLEGSVTEFSDGSTIRSFDSKTITISEASSSGSGDSGGSTTTTTTSSSAPTLSVLGITPYDFTGFKSGTTSYSVIVPNDCTSVSIYAKTNSSGATITGTGTVTLKEGTNKYTVTVSNSAGSKSYTISIIRKSEENEIVANSSDEEETENESSSGIGLDSLTITGYELNEEFNTNTYEYTVTVDDEITEELLEEIKSKIFWTANSEDVNVEYEIEVSEDGTTGTITLVVKDEEREYSRYVITFMNSAEEEEEKTIAVAGTTSSNNSGSDGTTTGLDITTKKEIALVVCIILIVGFGVYFSVNSYIKSKKLLEYEPKDSDDIDELETENIVESIMDEREKQEEKVPAMQEASVKDSENEEFLEQSNAAELLKDSRKKMSELGGYRKLRKGFSGGRH